MIKYILFGLIAFNFSVIHAQDLNKNDIKAFADKMLISKKYKIEVLKISDFHHNIRMALIKQPYREFPSILIFKFDQSSKKWGKVFEGLNPGIQDAQSGLLDLHTLKLGIDFTT